jgi:hypothetical protein
VVVVAVVAVPVVFIFFSFTFSWFAFCFLSAGGVSGTRSWTPPSSSVASVAEEDVEDDELILASRPSVRLVVGLLAFLGVVH